MIVQEGHLFLLVKPSQTRPPLLRPMLGISYTLVTTSTDNSLYHNYRYDTAALQQTKNQRAGIVMSSNCSHWV